MSNSKKYLTLVAAVALSLYAMYFSIRAYPSKLEPVNYKSRKAVLDAAQKPRRSLFPRNSNTRATETPVWTSLFLSKPPHSAIKRASTLFNMQCPYIENPDILENKLFNEVYVRKTITRTPFWISTHSKEYDRIRHAIFRRGYYYQQGITNLVEELIPPDPQGLVIDVGANVGWISLVAASRGAHALSFEPNKKNVVKLCQSILLNGFHRIKAFDIGLGRENGFMYFKEQRSNPGESGLTYGPNGTKVEVQTLDSVLESLNYSFWTQDEQEIYLLKVDVEGMEFDVLLGSQNLLHSPNLNVIVTEYEPGRKYNKQLMNLLVESGFMLRQVIPNYGARVVKYGYKTGETATASLKRLDHACQMTQGYMCNLVFMRN